MPERILLDNAEVTITEVTSADWPDVEGSTRSVRTVWKIVPDQSTANADALTAQVRASIDALIASRETLRAIRDKANASIGPADTKNVAREMMTLTKAVIALERLVGGAIDSTNTGTA